MLARGGKLLLSTKKLALFRVFHMFYSYQEMKFRVKQHYSGLWGYILDNIAYQKPAERHKKMIYCKNFTVNT